MIYYSKNASSKYEAPLCDVIQAGTAQSVLASSANSSIDDWTEDSAELDL